MYATFIQSTSDDVVNSALKIVTGEMWSSAAGEKQPQADRRNGPLFKGSICGRQYLSVGHGHPLGVGLHLLQVLITPSSSIQRVTSSIPPCFPASVFSPSRQATRFGPANPLFMLLSGKGQNSLVVAEVIHHCKQCPIGNAALAGHLGTRLFTGIAIVGAVGSGESPSRTGRRFIWG
jgi:hypothetical protein